MRNTAAGLFLLLGAVSASGQSLRVQYRAADTNPGDTAIKPHFNIVNGTTASVPLSELSIRYWYTIDGDQPQTSWCDWAGPGCANITRGFTKLGTAVSGADYYMQVGFTGSGSIPAGGSSGEMQLRFNKNDWSAYNEAGDYSYDPTKTSFADWNRVTLYRNGSLVWGTEPGGSGTPTPAPRATATARATAPPRATATATARPTATTRPTATPTATSRPRSTPTARPRPTATARPTPTPTASGAVWETVIDGSAFDSYANFESKFRYLYPWGSDHNGSARMYGSSTDHNHVSLSGGVLTLKASRITWDEGNSTASPYPKIYYHSGAVHAQHHVRVNDQFPNYEVKGDFQAPNVRGTWPAFWLTGANSWPPESDILEFKGNSDNWFNTFRTSSDVSTTIVNVSSPGSWHNYRVWIAKANATDVDIHYYLDGVWKAQHRGNFVDKPMWIIINLQMEGSSGAPGPNGDTFYRARGVYVGRTRAW